MRILAAVIGLLAVPLTVHGADEPRNRPALQSANGAVTSPAKTDVGGEHPGVAEPCLVFSKADLPTLQDRVKSGRCSEMWAAIRERADRYATPGTREFADPEHLCEPPADSRSEKLWVHHYGRKLTDWVETLGFAYQITGDQRYGSHGARILEQAARSLPVSDPRIASGFTGGRGDIMRGLAVGYDWLGEAMTENQRAAWTKTSSEYVRSILAEAKTENRWWVPHHNFMGVALGAAGCLAIKLRPYEPDQAQAWIDDCARLVEKWLNVGFDDQGAYFEGTSYAEYGLGNAVLFADALVRSGGPNLFDNPHLRKTPHFYALSLLPGESVFDARNDANYSGLRFPLMLRLADAYPMGLARWLWDRAGGGTSPYAIIWSSRIEPVPPEQAGVALSEHFAGRGLCVFRTGWETEDVMFSIEAGPFYPITHNQADESHFTLYGLGYRWAIDSGYGNTGKPGGRDQSVAHNCVLIDGEGQAISGAGRGTNGKILAYADEPSHGYVLADASEAYNRNSRGTPGPGVERARRHAVFVRPADGLPAYVVLYDDIRKDADLHKFTWLMHTSEELTANLLDDGAVLRTAGPSGGAYLETPVSSTGRGECRLVFQVEQSGDYDLWARVRVGGPEPGRSDSFFIRMDNGPTIDWHMPAQDSWTWGKVASGVQQRAARFSLAAGQHTLLLTTREPGAQIDQLVLARSTADVEDAEEAPDGIFLEAEAGQVTAPMLVVAWKADQFPRLRLHIRAAADARFEVDSYDGHPRLNAIVRATEPRFLAVLLPLPAGVAEPTLTADDHSGRWRVQLQWRDRRDTIILPPEGENRPTVRLNREHS